VMCAMDFHRVDGRPHCPRRHLSDGTVRP
jgi:hypothetical protein